MRAALAALAGGALLVTGVAIAWAQAGHAALCRSPFGQHAQSVSAAIAAHCAAASAWQDRGLIMGAAGFLAAALAVLWEARRPAPPG